MAGVSICVVALILDAVIGLWKKGVKDKAGFVICLLVFLLTEFTTLSPILFILSSGITGVILKNINGKKKEVLP